MRFAETFHRSTELGKGYRARKAAEIFAEYPELNTVTFLERGGSSASLGAPPQGTAYYVIASSGRYGKSAALRLSKPDQAAANARAHQALLAQQEENKKQFMLSVAPVVEWLKEQGLEKCFWLEPDSTVGILNCGMLLYERFHDVGGSMAFDVSNLSNADIIARIEQSAVGHAKVYHKERSR